MAILIGLVVAILAVLVVLDPILRASAASVRPSVLDEEADDPREVRKELALAALKEIEFDRATGKLSDGDYQAMLTRYTKEAVEALRDTEAVTGVAGGNGHAAPERVAGPGGVEADDPIERLIAETRAANRGRSFCSNCGAALEGSGRFCVECGARAESRARRTLSRGTPSGGWAPAEFPPETLQFFAPPA